MLPDPSLFALQRRLKNWVVGCMDWSCDRVSYVTTGRPVYAENSFHVWRLRGPYPQQATVRSDIGAKELVDLGVTCVTCTGTTPQLLPDGTILMPTPEEWEAAAAAHEGDVAAVYALLKRHAGWIKGSFGGHQEADPDAEVAGGCYGTTIRITVPWTAGAKCEECPEPPEDDGSVC